MKLHIHGGLRGAAQYGLHDEITLEQALLDGYRVWIDPVGWYVGDPMSHCRWSAWKAIPVRDVDKHEPPTFPPPKVITNPECRAGKHSNCDRNGWDTRIDSVCDCPCDCHEPKETNQ